MTIRRLRIYLTRLILIGAMAVALVAGSIALGPPHEAAAAPKGCASILAAARANANTGELLYQLGYHTEAIAYLARAAAYYDSYTSLCG